MSSSYTPPEKTSNEGQHTTGLVWSIRRESEQCFHGNHETRHDAVGLAAIIGRITGEETFVRAHESMRSERDEPLVCDYCASEDHYWPVVGWTFVTGDGPEAGTFCSTQCRARYERSADIDREPDHE